MEYIVGLVIAAILGNFLIRYFVAKADRTPDVDAAMPAVSPPVGSSIAPIDVLRQWGRPSASETNDLAQPLHASVVEFLRKYETLGPDEYLRVADRALATAPFAENPAFVQIGVWGDGSEVLAKLDRADARIYLADIEDGTPARPRVLANSIDDYLMKAWQYHQDS